jgi:MFS family permease
VSWASGETPLPAAAPPSTARSRYAAVLNAEHVRPLLFAATLARLPIGIHGLAIVLFLREQTGSYATAGAVAAAFSLGAGASGPVQGRAIDRLGQRRVIVPMISFHAAALLALVALGLSGAPTAALIATGLAAGSALPPLSSIMRTLWPRLLDDRDDLVATAFALDSVLIELVFVTGPLLTAAITALLAPHLSILLALVLGVVGCLWFVVQPPSRDWRPPEHHEHVGPLGALRSRGLRTLIIAVVPFGFCFGAMEVTLPAFAEDHGARPIAGVLLSIWSLASAAGGLTFGARRPVSSLPLSTTFVWLALVLPLAYLPLAAAPSIPVMALLLIPAGACIAPLLSAGNLLVTDVSPAGVATEAYTWPITSLIVGLALGNAAAGAIVEAADWRVAFLAASASAGLGGALALGRRASLRPVESSTAS